LNILAAAFAAGKKRQKHFCASMLNLHSHPVWQELKGAHRIESAESLSHYCFSAADVKRLPVGIPWLRFH
jgi:hypothetical protein